MSKIVGIDLGTTNSLIAVWENGKSTLIPNAFGEYLTPSVISIDDEENIYVGKAAKERLAAHPSQTASVFKRFMGTSKKYTLGAKTYLPEELSALVLMKLKEDAENYLGEPVEEAIISVPAYFNDMARTATKRAGIMAGFKVERIINEPSAAALACHNTTESADGTFLVFDCGGGTLDVSLVECFDNIVEILAVSGDNQLGGQDFDDMLGTYFIRTLNLNPAELSAETRALIRSGAEKCKRELTEQKTAQLRVNCPQVNETLNISRKELITICSPLFERMSKPVKRVLMDSRMPASSMERIVLVGGSCKMPVVQQYLRHLLKRDDIETVNPDHMIALGCGVYAGIKERDADIKDTLLTDICPFSLGTGVRNEQDLSHALMDFIIPRNSPLPISNEKTYFTAEDNQPRITINVYQGEAMYAEDNILLGSLSVEIPPRPRGMVQCRIRYTYDINGVLEVNLHIPMTGEDKQLVIVNEELGMSEEQINKTLEKFKRIKLSPMEEEENQFVLSWGERLFRQCNNELQEEIKQRLQFFFHTMETDIYQVPKVRKYVTVFLAYAERLLDRYANFDEEEIKSGSWYEDEDDAEIDNLFREWDDKDGD